MRDFSLSNTPSVSLPQGICPCCPSCWEVTFFCIALSYYLYSTYQLFYWFSYVFVICITSIEHNLLEIESPDLLTRNPQTVRTRLAHSRGSKQICGQTNLFADSHSSNLFPDVWGFWVNQKDPAFWVWIKFQAHLEDRRGSWVKTWRSTAGKSFSPEKLIS